MGNEPTSSAMLTFTFDTAASTIRTWEIKATQISCSSRAKYTCYIQFSVLANFDTEMSFFRPYDNSCLQYYTGITGRIESFNFLEPTATAQVHLPSQRQFFHSIHDSEKGFIKFSVCYIIGIPPAFAEKKDFAVFSIKSAVISIPSISIYQPLLCRYMDLHALLITLELQVESNCNQVLLKGNFHSSCVFKGGSQTCDRNPMSGSAIHPGRFCGKFFGAIVLGAIADTPVCCK